MPPVSRRTGAVGNFRLDPTKVQSILTAVSFTWVTLENSVGKSFMDFDDELGALRRDTRRRPQIQAYKKALQVMELVAEIDQLIKGIAQLPHATP